eukprot:1822803-Pyramimonas_sp.AAC.1
MGSACVPAPPLEGPPPPVGVAPPPLPAPPPPPRGGESTRWRCGRAHPPPPAAALCRREAFTVRGRKSPSEGGNH